MDTPINGEALERLLAHEARYFQMVATLETKSSAWWLTSSELPEYPDANRALHLRDDGRGPEAVAREVAAHFRALRLPIVADIDPVAEAQGIGNAIRQMDIRPVRQNRLWMRYAASVPPTAPVGSIAVRQIARETEADVQAWIEISLCEDEEPEERAIWRKVMECEARTSANRLYMGSLDGQDAGVCDLFAADGWGRVDSVATLPAFRRRGIATALVTRAVADSLELGHTVTYLQTDADSSAARLYARLGFASWGLNLLHRHVGR